MEALRILVSIRVQNKQKSKLTKTTSMTALFSRRTNQAEAIKVMTVTGKAAIVRINSKPSGPVTMTMNCNENPVKKKKSNLRRVV
jgi:ArsR family metal-binding transcriptional regulator